jgi:mRNA interferase YafQ
MANILTSVLLTQYRRDLKRSEKRGKPMEKMRQVILLLLSAEPLPARYRDHTLSGDWVGHRECHVDPDWLLIYKVDTESLYLVRTGSHSDLFSK